MKTGAKKSGTTVREHRAPAVPVEQATTEKMDMETLRGQIRNLVCKDAIHMVSTTIGEVNGGHYQALKYLFEMIGLFPASAGEEVPQEDSLASMLLNRLEMGPALAATEPANPRVKAGVPPGTP